MKGPGGAALFLVVLSLLFSGSRTADVSLAAIDADSRPSAGVILPAFEGPQNTFFGQGAGAGGILTSGANGSTFIGALAGNATTQSALKDTFIGYGAGFLNTSGSDNTSLGYLAGRNNTTGNRNTAIGSEAGLANATGQDNVFVGFASGTNTTSNGNTFVGSDAGSSNTAAGSNTFLGYKAGRFSTGANNTFVGWSAGHFHTSGISNTFLGYAAGLEAQSGNFNTYIGTAAGEFNTSGANNTFLGFSAGTHATGSGNVFLGFGAGDNEPGSNKLYIDNSNTATPLIYGQFDNDILTVNGKLGVGTTTPATAVHLRVPGNSTMRMESSTGGGAALDFTAGPAATAFGTITNHPIVVVTQGAERMRITNAGVGIFQPSPTHQIHLGGGAFSDGAAWSNASSASIKRDFQDIDAREVLEKVAQLPVRSWSYAAEDASVRHVGPTAEDFYAAFALGGDDKSIGTVDADGVALAAVQGLYQVVKEKEQRIASLEARLAALENGGAPAPSASTSPTAAGASTSSWSVAGIAAVLAAVTGAGAYALRRRPAA